MDNDVRVDMGGSDFVYAAAIYIYQSITMIEINWLKLTFHKKYRRGRIGLSPPVWTSVPGRSALNREAARQETGVISAELSLAS